MTYRQLSLRNDGKQQAARLLLMQQSVCIWSPPEGDELQDFIEFGILYGDGGGSMPYNPAALEMVAQSGFLAIG